MTATMSHTERKQRVLQLLKETAAKLCQEGDPWAKHNLQAVPAECIIRHLYHPDSQSWSSDETIVKISPEPFTHGAMRYCYRMKKRAQPPKSATNHHFHKMGWAHAPNYVAKAYHKDGEIDTSDEAKKAVQNDIMLQFEAEEWAKRFNQSNPPSKVHFIRAYAIEFPDRPGRPWMAVERFIAGKDMYGASFVKHNTNAGFVDTDLHRITPQVFSAHSFYASEGTRLVADIQGVGDLWTDPQVLSNDYRFGDGDLGPRGMALFFKNYRHSALSDSLGIPIFALSKNELKVQAKYEEDEVTISDDEDSYTSDVKLDRFQRMDLNRLRRSSMLMSPRELLPLDKKDTVRRSNISRSRAAISASFRQSLTGSPTGSPVKSALSPRGRHAFHRTKSDVNEVEQCLERARRDLEFTHHDFHRKASGGLRDRQYKGTKDPKSFRKSAVVRTISAPMVPTSRTKENLGKVHYQLAVLHGMDRFPDVVPEHDDEKAEDRPAHDGFSVLFHLSYAAALHNAPACLALARVHSGLDSTVSNLLSDIVRTDFYAAKDLLRRAMTAPYPPVGPKAAAGCLLYQILHDEANVAVTWEGPLMIDEDSEHDVSPEMSDRIMAQIIEETLLLLQEMEQEASEASKCKSRLEKSAVDFHGNDRVEANYCLEGTFYPGTVVDVSDGGARIAVEYDDDGSREVLDKEHVRLLVPPTATQTSLGGPLSDDEAFGSEHGDDKFLLKDYELKAELAELKEKAGELARASSLFEEAADGAVADGRMQMATKWSLKAAELQT